MATKEMETRVLERMFLRPQENDDLVLDDATLLAALENRQPLSREQWQAMMDSPLTLRRFRILAHRRQARLEAANDFLWSESEGMRLAADSGEEVDVLRTQDGFWSLHFLQEAEGWLVVLKLDAAAPYANGLLTQQVKLEAVIGDGVSVLAGQLDASFEVEASWPFAETPLERLRRAGGRFVVRMKF